MVQTSCTLKSCQAKIYIWYIKSVFICVQVTPPLKLIFICVVLCSVLNAVLQLVINNFLHFVFEFKSYLFYNHITSFYITEMFRMFRFTCCLFIYGVTLYYHTINEKFQFDCVLCLSGELLKIEKIIETMLNMCRVFI